MSANRPFVLSIAGFDPSGGAGVLADIKTFEQHRVYGLSIITGNTIQTENSFQSIQWMDLDFVLDSVRTLFEHYEIEAVKIGIVPSLAFLKKIILEIKQSSTRTKIVWDTVLKSTTEFEFIRLGTQTELFEILNQIDLITPNYQEIKKLNPGKTSGEEIAKELSQYCAVLLKGGHHPQEKGTDYLFTNDKIIKINPLATGISEKHGSGCVLSSAIAANLALNNNLSTSCKKAKLYIENYLNSNNTLLGYHYV
ncbi:hydroxymethylpyrimidine/phosphomethylpyrimidine kinase [Flavobacterium sp. SM15]|uniref:hydroxymethylpyrimidine/phosphomethylpyrimidine kinase n=1 Tax=Flavobacterium sp. SM15 TaxID=2908005 RepID=UPI001EDAF1CF|nr:hydroxymethylpyrimidine/phosphomethylpyrimidine kinase [Flavobacterium sp. SM15]MCG2610876.1 hydroxymethylpyrimidine/phosphomethylpyrimidine kinase [Flavobacterium sp. SM15]